MKPVNIAEFKTHLGKYLRVVRKGGTVVVADRGTPVATVVPFPAPARPRMEFREAEGPASDLAKLPRLPPTPPGCPSLLDLLLDDRGVKPLK